MKPQVASYLCGPASVANALEVHGQRCSRYRVARLAGTTSEGSDETDLIQAIDALGFTPSEFQTDNQNEARQWLKTHAPVLPLLLCVDRWMHWICVAGMCGSRLIAIDPDPPPRHDPVKYVLPKRLLKRWRATRAQEGERYYGIAVLAPDSTR